MRIGSWGMLTVWKQPCNQEDAFEALAHHAADILPAPASDIRG